ncbi:MAG: Lacal_2735 family protein [Proteobacteria bacterium]|nr:Lacal_2735 family protein [Pseudomonadota bacterium]
MFGWFRRDPIKDLERRYQAKMKEAKEAGEKYGDRQLQAALYTEADELMKQLEALEAEAAP